MKDKIVVSDTTAITHLARIGALHLVHELYMTIYIPEAVYNELTAHGDDVPGAKEVKTYPWIKTKQVQNLERVRTLSNTIDPGESEAIALAQEIKADLLIIDEKIGRMHAKAAGLTITGMIGILILAKQKKLIPKVKPYLDNLIATKFKLSMALYNQALVMAGERTENRRA